MYWFEYDAKLHDEVLQEEAFENGLAEAKNGRSAT